MKMKLLVAAMGAALALASASASASFVAQYNNVDFTLEQTDSNSFTFRVQNALNATGSWNGAAWVDNMGFVSLGDFFTGGTVTPGSWGVSPELMVASGDGCFGLNFSGVCAQTSAPYKATNDMTFAFNLTGGELNLAETGNTPAFAVHWLKNSWLVPNRPGDDLEDVSYHHMRWVEPTVTAAVPEPASLALMGAGLLAMGMVSRRRKYIG